MAYFGEWVGSDVNRQDKSPESLFLAYIGEYRGGVDKVNCILHTKFHFFTFSLNVKNQGVRRFVSV